jgi:hypothetical protein
MKVSFVKEMDNVSSELEVLYSIARNGSGVAIGICSTSFSDEIRRGAGGCNVAPPPQKKNC